MTTKQLADALSRVRDNDIVAGIGGCWSPVVGMHYNSDADRYVLDLDPEETEDAVWAEAGLSDLDGAFFAVWLHGDWFQLTQPMTSEQREAAAAAVRRHEQMIRDANEPVIFDPELCWWDPVYRHNVYGVDTWRLERGAQVVLNLPDGTRSLREVDRRSSQSIRLTNGTEVSFSQVIHVKSSPADEALARLDAPTTTDSKEN